MFEAASAKSDAIRLAEVREKEAEAAIRNVLESIEAGRKNKSTATNPQVPEHYCVCFLPTYRSVPTYLLTGV